MVTLAVAAAPRWPTPPAWWLAQARCISSGIEWRGPGAGRPVTLASGRRFWGESSGRVHATSSTVNRGLYQFAYGTWRRAGGLGDPATATAAEQTYRAWIIYKRDGDSWREWSTAAACGLS